jgi:ankyrin repeat protein
MSCIYILECILYMSSREDQKHRRIDTKRRSSHHDTTNIYFSPFCMLKGMLIFHARDGDTVTVRELLSTTDAQSFINYQDASGVTPLSCSAHNGHAAVTEQLIDARCNIDLPDKFDARIRRSITTYDISMTCWHA